MTSVLHTPRTPAALFRRRTTAAGTALLATSLGLLGATAGTAQAAPVATPVPLGTTEPFAVLSGSAFTNTGTTTIAGDIGASNPSMVGTSSVVLTGTNHRDDGVTASANAALTNARSSAAGQGPGDSISADLAGQTLTPGVYTSASSLSIAGPVPLVLDGGGDPDAVFLFQAGSTLVTQPNTTVSLINGANACNVFWEVGSSTTLGVNSVFRGVILTLADSTLNTGATLEGSVLSSGSVSLDSNTILRPGCASAPVQPPVTTPPTTTPGTPTATPTVPAPPTPGDAGTPGDAATPSGTTPSGTSTGGTTTGGTTTGGTATTGSTGPRPTTYGQVAHVPVGSVDTGDGSTAADRVPSTRW